MYETKWARMALMQHHDQHQGGKGNYAPIFIVWFTVVGGM